MFGRAKLIRELRAKVTLREAELRTARLNEGQERRERKAALKLVAEWAARAERIGDDRIADAKRHVRTKLAAANLTVQAADWSSLSVEHAERLGRALRGCARYRQEIGRLNVELSRLQKLVDETDIHTDRAVLAASPVADAEWQRRQIAQLQALVVEQQQRLDAYQRASEAADWRGSEVAA